MPEASLGMHPLMLEGWLTQPQPPRGHLARTRVTDSAAEITGPGPVGQLAGEAAASIETSQSRSKRRKEVGEIPGFSLTLTLRAPAHPSLFG